MPAPKPAVTPLLDFLTTLAEIKSKRMGGVCANVLETMMFLPESAYGKSLLEEIEKTFDHYIAYIDASESKEVGHWIRSWLLPYKQGLEELARTLKQARKLHHSESHLAIVVDWNNLLREQVQQLLEQDFSDRRLLCAFSSAVDATYALDSEDSLAKLVTHAADYLGTTPEQLREAACRQHRIDPKDREKVATVVELLAALLFGYEHPRANNKPNLQLGSEAEKWARQFFVQEQEKSLSLRGGGASVNILDALAGLGLSLDGFWPYHPQMLADCKLLCAGQENKRVYRRWFNEQWQWEQSDFSEAGNDRDGTRHEHPIRLSLICSFSARSPAIQAISDKVSPASKGRVIFQFRHHLAEFFATGKKSTGNWDVKPGFHRWRYSDGVKPEPALDLNMQKVREAGYHRLILSAFHWADGETLQQLQAQCRDMSLHHEISGRFESAALVNQHLRALKKVYQYAGAKTAGMNDEELAAFTSWQRTEVFAAALPERKDSFLQAMFRALKVREVLSLDWLYLHGNDIDITVVSPEVLGAPPAEQYLKQLRDAMLLAKVAVFAALHVRAEVSPLTPDFELSCSPKGFLALHQFAREFARQYGLDEQERAALQRDLLLKGYVCGNARIPSVVTVPVYWPDPHEDCSVTGAGDISSGVMAAMAP